MCGAADVRKYKAYLYLGYFGGRLRIGRTIYKQEKLRVGGTIYKGNPKKRELVLKKLMQMEKTDLCELIVGFAENAYEY